MPHYKCHACRARLYSAAAAADLVDPSCPTCGAQLHAQESLAVAEHNLLQAVAERRLRRPRPLVTS
jgi:hypothetical protein